MYLIRRPCLYPRKRQPVIVAAALLLSLLFLYYMSHRVRMLPAEFRVGMHLVDGVSLYPGMCVSPEFPLWPPEFASYFDKPAPLTCSQVEANWVYVDKGIFLISSSAVRRHGNIWCNFRPLLRGENDVDVSLANAISDIKSGTPITADFFDATCTGADGAQYENLHAGIAPVAEPKIAPSSWQRKSLGFNIVVIGFDSVSRLAWMRTLPKTYDYLVKILGAVVLEGYNIVGDGTPSALLPILTGKNEKELPEARRAFERAKPIDNHPWIWKDLRRMGYVTQFGEDDTTYSTFTYRMLGFKQQPTDHYFRPYAIESEAYDNRPLCVGSLPEHVNLLNYVRQMFRTYSRSTRKFSFLFMSKLSHDSSKMVNVADDDVVDLLQFLAKDHLNDTVLVLMSDHGSRFSSFRSSVQGKYEERNPFMSIRFPPSFEEFHPAAIKNLRTNAHRLTTPYDIHATLWDIINYNAVTMGDVKQAAVPSHWCACLSWTKLDIGDPSVKKAAEALLATVNSETLLYRDKCEELQLTEILNAVKFAPSSDILRYKGSSDFDGYKADMSDKMSSNDVLYQLTIVTSPGLARYEATVRLHIQQDLYESRTEEISRTNKYGKQPHCVTDRLPHLRKYCYCKTQLR